MKHFYSHLIEIESLTIELDKIDLADHEKDELAQLIDRNIHNTVMDAILSKIPDSEKRKFAEIANSKDHKKIWEFLQSKSDNIEEEIRKAAREIKKKLHEDVEEAKKLR